LKGNGFASATKKLGKNAKLLAVVAMTLIPNDRSLL
jgi:hypothetical protein